MKTTGNTKALGVPSEVHALAVALAKRDGLHVYEVIAKALDRYQRWDTAQAALSNNGAAHDNPTP